ncbi:hypothetical protein ACFQX7_11095 [Luedemannella flava]
MPAVPAGMQDGPVTIATLVRAAGWLLGTALVVVGTAKVPPDAGERPADALAQVVVVGAGVAAAAAWRWPSPRPWCRSPSPCTPAGTTRTARCC